MKANFVQVNNDQKSSHLLSEEQIQEFDLYWDQHKYNRLAGRDRILAAFCPQVTLKINPAKI